MSRRSSDDKQGMSWLPIIIGVSVIIILAGGTLGATFFSGEMTRVGGTNWGFDYEWSALTVNGEEGPSETRDTPGTWSWDPDGDPRWVSDNPERPSPYWEGLSPGVGCTVSLAGRVDKNYNEIDYDMEDPTQVSYNVSDTIYFLYYYKFTVTLKTIADTYADGLGIRHAEAGPVDIYATLTIILDRGMFSNTTWNGWFQDAHIYEDTLTETPEGLTFSLEPKIVKLQEVGSRLDFENTQTITEGYHYEGDLVFRAKLTSGLVRSGLNDLPYEVFITRTVIVGILLHKPLEVGLGTEEKPDQPPDPPDAPWKWLQDWWMQWGWIIIIIIVLILVCVCASFMCSRSGVSILRVGD